MWYRLATVLSWTQCHSSTTCKNLGFLIFLNWNNIYPSLIVKMKQRRQFCKTVCQPGGKGLSKNWNYWLLVGQIKLESLHWPATRARCSVWPDSKVTLLFMSSVLQSYYFNSFYLVLFINSVDFCNYKIISSMFIKYNTWIPYSNAKIFSVLSFHLTERG